MIGISVVGVLLATGLTVSRLWRKSRLYQSRAEMHARAEKGWRNAVSSVDRPWRLTPHTGGRLQVYLYYQTVAEHHMALKQAFRRGSRRPWEQPPIETPDPSFQAVCVRLGPSLIRLAREHRMKDLDLNHAGITDDLVKEITECPELLILDLSSNPITDRGLAHLRGLKKLLRLNLSRTQVTDAGLDSLKELTNLIDLGLHRTRVTNEGLSNLSQALPKVDISLGPWPY
jgi:hypothetical protein